MGFKRYVAATTRDAMRQVRQELGDGAVILSSKRIAGGNFEILAAAADAVEAIVEEARKPRVAAAQPRPPVAVRRTGGVESFHDFLKRQNAPRSESPAPSPATRAPASAAVNAATMYADVAATRDAAPEMQPSADDWWDEPAPQARPRTPLTAAASAPSQVPSEPTVFRRRPTRELQAAPGLPASVPAPAPLASPAREATMAASALPRPTAATVPTVPGAAPASMTALSELQLPQPVTPAHSELMVELQNLRAALQEQLTALSTSVAAGDAARNPLVTRLMTRLLSAGFSADVARRIAQHAPPDLELAGAPEWLHSVIALNLRCADSSTALIDRPGVFALVGPTGVGKTTTVAKLAARFAVKYGTGALGLITLDAYRVAAHEQLRTYGRILGAPVHLAQDSATLRELLASMRGKRFVLIDTCGVGPRDDRLNEMLGMLAEAGRDAQRVQPVLLLNAGSHIETLDETARAWRAQQAAGAILTKLDEAARIGGALDCALRHRLSLLALTNGQRVPEDLHLPNAKVLAHLALKPGAAVFALAESEAAALAAAG